MNKLHDYLDFKQVRIICTNGEEFVGTPIVVNYADETESGEEELTIENGELYAPPFVGFPESKIQSIEGIW